MKGKNCPNCGAVYEPEKNKCPYCGTSYYDMSALNFESSEPFYLKIKTNINGKPVYITQLVKPYLDRLSINFDADYTTVLVVMITVPHYGKCVQIRLSTQILAFVLSL